MVVGWGFAFIVAPIIVALAQCDSVAMAAFGEPAISR